MKRKDALWVMQMRRDRDARSEAEREAFDTAIEALKSESIFTADRPQKVIAQITFDEEKLREIVKEAVERFKEEYEIADRPRGEWIPVSEKLPDDGKWAIWCSNDGIIGIARFKEDCYNHFYPNGTSFGLEDAVAWMPLPEPYKGGDDK